MFTDPQQLSPKGAPIDTDVCILGGGAAGITLAGELSGSGLRTLLLESGSEQYDQRTQDLYEGVEEGRLVPPESDYLGSTRLRYLGGTTNHWNGWCRPLDAQDMAACTAIDRPGWPIDRSDLDRYYARACEWVQVEPFTERHALTPGVDLLGPGSEFHTTSFHVSPPIRFRRLAHERLGTSGTVSVLTETNGTELVPDADGRRVDELHAIHRWHRELRVRARCYVLATGALENARLLLASRSVVAEGLGNRHDRVGRCFMEHLHGHAGSIVLSHRPRDMRLFAIQGSGGRRWRGALHLDEGVRLAHQLRSAIVVLERHQRTSDRIAEDAFLLSAAIERSAGAEPEGIFQSQVWFSGEQTPSDASRVRLADSRDELGVPRIHLEWRPRDDDIASLFEVCRLLARRIGRNGIGRMQLAEDVETFARHVSWSPHQMGTTRMSTDPRDGVVDPHGRVHGLENLYVAGGSVFPTSGISNPTLTIVALAIRLAEHLRRRLGR